MKITRRPSTNVPGLGDTIAPEAPSPTSRPDATSPTDRVQLSEAARLRQRLKTETGDPTQPTASGEQIAALQSQVANQTYAPSPHAVAQRMLGELTADLIA